MYIFSNLQSRENTGSKRSQESRDEAAVTQPWLLEPPLKLFFHAFCPIGHQLPLILGGPISLAFLHDLSSSLFSLHLIVLHPAGLALLCMDMKLLLGGVPAPTTPCSGTAGE